MRRSTISSLLLLFLRNATSTSFSLADLSTLSSENEDLFFSETPSSDLESLDLNIMNPPLLTEEIMSDPYDTISDYFLSSEAPSECSDLLPFDKIRARSSGFCSDTQNPSSSNNNNGDRPSTDRILTAEDVENYWCSGSRILGFGIIPVCEAELYAADRLAGPMASSQLEQVIFCDLCLFPFFSVPSQIQALDIAKPNDDRPL